MTAALLAAATLLLTGGIIFAQVTQTGVIAGQVVDSETEPIPAARVTVNNTELLGSRVSTITDGEGRFRIPGLPPGAYTIEIIHEDFNRQVLENVYLKVDEVVRLMIVLQVEGEETINIPRRPAPLIDLAKHGLKDSLPDEMLERLPLRRSTTAALLLFPGAVEIEGWPAICGGTPRDNAWHVDGIDLTNPHQGTLAVEPVLDMVTGVELISALLDSRSKPAIGGEVEISTITGNRNLSGEASLYFNTSSLNGNNYPGTQKPDDYMVMPGFSIGGPSFGGRSWFYGGINYLRSRISDSPTRLSPEESSRHMLQAKTTFRFNERTDLRAAYLRSGGTSDNYYSPDTALWTILESDPDRVNWDQTSDTNILSFGVDYRLSETVRLHLDAERLWLNNDFLPASGDTTYRSRYDPVDFVVYQGSPETEWNYSESDRWLLEGGFDYYLDELAGRHEISLGLEFEHSVHNVVWDTTGENRSVFINRPEWENERELYIELYRTMDDLPGPISSQNSITRFSVFARDSWSPFPSLALHFGVRYDGPAIDNSGTRILDWDEISPRIGISWDPAGNGKMVLRAGYARYHQAAVTTRAPSDPYYTARLFNAATLKALGYSNFETFRTPTIFDSATRYGYSEDWNETDLETEAPLTDEYHMAMEYEIDLHTSAEFNVVFRNTNDLLEDLETNLWDHYTTASGIDSIGGIYSYFVRNPGVNGGYSPDLYWTNNKELKRDYLGLGFVLRSKPSTFLNAQIHYLWSTTKGNIDTTMAESSSFSSVLNSPNTSINNNGYLSTDHRHDLKVLLYGNLPFELNFGAVIGYLSGAPYNRLLTIPAESDPHAYTETVFADPRGTVYLHDDRFTVDLRAEKALTVDGSSLRLMLDVFNLMNYGAVTERLELDGLRFGEALARIRPRSIRLGFSYSF